MKTRTDKDPWNEFFDTYCRLVRRVARRAGLTEVATQEVVQEMIVLFAQEAAKSTHEPEKGSFKRWLRESTRWHIANKLRKNRELRWPPRL